ncbi:MAG: glycosyltransferase family 2 protein [Patescibacteria group bacterium]|nr:glycosyltransferase family 2 protein [Patescibacteria group bacterium]
MKISVIIPVYNEEKYIEQCLQSIINQSEKPDEIIIVDNNCNDKTVEIAKKYPVKIIKEKKQGLTCARNRGFDEVKYEIIARCDADTILPKNWIETIKKNFQSPIDALSGPIIFYNLPIKTALFSQIYLAFMKILLMGKNILIGPNMVITKKTWQKIKKKVCLDDKKVHEDVDLAIHINQIDGKIKIDSSLIAFISARRIKNNPFSFFIEYPLRLIKTLISHY